MSDCDNKRKEKGLKPCKPSQICNPETTRCVSRTGNVGKKLLKKMRSKSKTRRSKSKSKARRSKSKARRSKSKARRSKSKARRSKSKARKSKSKSVKIDYSENIKFIATQIFGQTGAFAHLAALLHNMPPRKPTLNLTLSKGYRDKLSSYIDKTVKFLVEKLNTMSLKEFSGRFNTNSLEKNANSEGTKAIGNSLKRISKTTDDAIFFKSFYENIVKNIMKYKKKTSSRLQDIEFIVGYCEYMLAELVELSIEGISDEGVIPLDAEKKTVTAGMLSKAIKNDKELAKFYS